MHISERTNGAVTILDLKGRLVLSDGDTILKKKVHGLIHQGRKHIVLNLAEVPYIDSLGISQIVGALMLARHEGGNLKLADVSPRVHEVLVITRLLMVFDVFPTEADAIRSFPIAH